MACVGSFAIGLTSSAFRMVAPLYATDIGLDVAGVAIFMSLGIIGGAIFQYPLGRNVRPLWAAAGFSCWPPRWPQLQDSS